MQKNEKEILDSIKGGLADGLTVEDIANKHGVSKEDIEKQITMGIEVEKEHTDLLIKMEEEEHIIMGTKGKEYTQGDLEKDRLANFYRIGNELGIDPKTVLYVYMKKHWDSITCYVKNGKEYSDETIEGRIHDARNYLVLLNAIIQEQKIKGV